ncbi:putative ligand-binding protein with streptavidin-like fold [Microbacterium sp. SLBN-154]|uniref:Atu4866 domain-containing protein n=1 Tax=Microbacterium sp. SLBN-154 TaxID=2768458 RepID=UPI00117216EC|nr:Atu4866 domain-containing protein [Microbacterium sp. SLBN-154]TQK17985.1 putative ligand-binding protein with streptavidin-like fold [Microbacterium sp. SLBN-154]
MTDLIVSGATIQRTPTDIAVGDLVVRGSMITSGEAPADAAAVIDGRGASVVPLFVDTVFGAPEPPASDAFDLVPGNPATFAVIDGRVGPDEIRHMLVVRPERLRAVVVDGSVIVRDGHALRPAGTDLNPGDPRLTAWTDTRRDMTQYLTADGRYSETRGGRRDAWTGRFWIDGERITYLDDSGFWAFGQFHGGQLHHAGFVLES